MPLLSLGTDASTIHHMEIIEVRTSLRCKTWVHACLSSIWGRQFLPHDVTNSDIINMDRHEHSESHLTNVHACDSVLRAPGYMHGSYCTINCVCKA